MLSPPEPITIGAVAAHFDCGRKQLDRWLIRHALANELTGRSRTFVVRDLDTSRIVGFYCLSTSVVAYAEATARAQEDVPANEPIPAVLLGRLAIDLKHQGQGLGSALLADAVRRTFYEVAKNTGVRVMLVHAKDYEAQGFYLRWGFETSPTDDLHLMLLMQDVEASGLS